MKTYRVYCYNRYIKPLEPYLFLSQFIKKSTLTLLSSSSLTALTSAIDVSDKDSSLTNQTEDNNSMVEEESSETLNQSEGDVENH